ncbi:hypothetical protein AgCh_039789 [Apium graveolens]
MDKNSSHSLESTPMEKVDVVTAIWKPRDSENSAITLENQDSLSKMISLQSNQPVKAPESSILMVVKNMENLKILKKRGRPKKKFSNMPVKAFHIPAFP